VYSTRKKKEKRIDLTQIKVQFFKDSILGFDLEEKSRKGSIFLDFKP
jgi:hypothetical protein